MRTCYYYSSHVNQDFGGMNACSLASSDYPIMVNCAGRIVANKPFVTDNVEGRADYYLIYVECGELEIAWNGGICTARSGSVIIFPPHYHYQYTFYGEHTLSYLWAHFTGSYAERFLGECGFGSLPCIFHSEPDIKIVSRFDKLFDTFASHERLQRQKLACSLEEILLRIASGLNGRERSISLAGSLGYIHAFYSRELRIPELAKMESLSNSRYITVFKKHMGMAPSDYVINLRINVACDLLKSSDMSIKEIAASVGYDNAHFFSKLFKKKTGVSPKAYREGEL